MSAGKHITAGEVAALVGGELFAEPSIELSGIRPLETAEAEHISFFAPSSAKKHAQAFAAAKVSKAGLLLVRAQESELPAAQLVVDNPMAAIVRIAIACFPKPRLTPGIDPRAAVDPEAVLGENVAVGPFAVIGKGAIIGPNTQIYPQVVVYPGAVIGDNCVIHAGAVIREEVILGSHCMIQNGAVVGGDGFGYIPDPEVGHRHIPHIGIVRLGDGVDLGANTTVDRGTLGETRLGRSTKVDNLVMVGHNTQIGERSLLCGLVGVSGSCSIGDDVILGGGAGVADHITIGDGAKIAARAGVTGHLKAGSTVGGYPATELHGWRRSHILIGKLTELFKRVQRLERRIGKTHDDGASDEQ